MTDAILECAVQAARLGGGILMNYLENGVEMRDKSEAGGKSYDLVSDADIESEKAIADFIRDSFPDHELMGEEGLQGDPNAEHLWVIDPLDGTNNYAHQIPHFAVSIGYFHHGKPVVGVVLNPARDDLFTAVAGQGAQHNGQPASVSSSDTLSNELIGCGFYYDRGSMMRATLSAIEEFFAQDIHGIRRFGTAALDLCMVGCGNVGGFFEYKLSPWDFAAGMLFVQEAGGKITDATGQPLRIAQSSVVASNAKLHELMIAITSKHQVST